VVGDSFLDYNVINLVAHTHERKKYMKNQIRTVILFTLMLLIAFSARAEQGDTVLFFD